MVVVAQLVRASVCGTEGRGFEPHHPPKKGSWLILNQLLYLKEETDIDSIWMMIKLNNKQ